MSASNPHVAYSILTLYSTLALAIPKFQVPLPIPGGTYQVGRSTIELIDTTRNQPFAPDVEPVRLMVTVFYPVCSLYPLVAETYFPPITAGIEDVQLSEIGLAAPNGTFEKLTLQLAKNHYQTEKIDSRHNSVVTFMPGLGTTRLFYSQIASTVASKGYTVVAIDAPYDADIVEYPDGSIISQNDTVWSTEDSNALLKPLYTAVETRAADVSFVLDSLSNKTLAHSLIPNLPDSGLNTTHTAMFGHSLGGATAFSVLKSDDRIIGGLNMDGALFGPGLDRSTTKPFMLMGHENHTRENKEMDPYLTWQTAWPNLKGWRRTVIVDKTLHYDFSDFPILFETLGITPNETVGTGDIQIGSLEGKRTLDIVTSYVGAFLDFVLHGKCSELLDGPVAEYPEVTFEF